MLVFANYHMDTLSGIGYRSEHVHGGYLYGERRIHTLSMIYAWCGDYICLFADVQSSMIFTWMIENGIKIHNDNHVSIVLLYMYNVCINFVTYKFCYWINNVCINFVTV